ncbi:uncharacterized protein [Mytilus edulis]|uniref:uncharacterized protein isoform X1 n=1 Tax=Mytilus edulis TaxID=6550 RepID=UPI0039EFB685
MTTDLSISFYHYLCQKIGTPDIVKIRRLSYAICDYVSRFSGRDSLALFWRFVTRISSGSKAEGLDMKKSDLDMMHVLELLNIVEVPLDSCGLFSFLITTEYTKPGFVRLKRLNAGLPMLPLDKDWCKERDGHIFLSSELFKTMQFLGIEKYTHVILHGPCLTTVNESHDHAICLRSKTWIAQSQKWVFRNRIWPSSELVSQIISYGVLFVPIGNRDSQNEDLEWRISFSMAEKHLIYSFTHTQLLSYALLKILLKDIIDLNAFCKGLLCSYFIKTLMFWVLEEADLLTKPNDLISYFHLLICRLRYYVQISFLPHYFIPENNLFENRFNSEQQKVLVDMLTDIHEKGIYCFINSKTVSDFFATDLKSWNLLTDFDFNLITTPLSILEEWWYYDVPTNILVVLFRRHKMVSHRYLYTLFWCAICQHIGYKNIGIQEQSNKGQYKRYKTYLPWLVMGLQKDAITGWLCLASYHFSIDSYKTCLNLIDHILQKYGFRAPSDIETHIGHINNLELEAVKYGIMNPHDICRRHFVDVHGFNDSIKARPLKLKLDILDNLSIVTSPLIYTHFLRFMCCFHLHDSCGVKFALREIHRLRTGREISVHYCLGLAYYTLKEYSTALSFLIPFSEYLKSNPKVMFSVYADLNNTLDRVITKLKKLIS